MQSKLDHKIHSVKWVEDRESDLQLPQYDPKFDVSEDKMAVVRTRNGDFATINPTRACRGTK